MLGVKGLKLREWKGGGGAGAECVCVCEPEERERDKQSYERAGGRRGSKWLLFGTNVLYFKRKLNYIDVDDSVLFHIAFEKISIYFKYRYTAQP